MSKREGNISFIQLLLKKDLVFTTYFVRCMVKRFGPVNNYKTLMKILEISGHGIPWIFGSASSVFIFKNPAIRRFALNTLIAIILDTSIVSGIKAVARRKRPMDNADDMFATYSVDKFSFPSGHAARSAMLAFLLPLQYNLKFPVPALLILWCIMLSISRVMLKRHHLLDVAGGVLIGFVEATLLNKLNRVNENLVTTVLQHIFNKSDGTD